MVRSPTTKTHREEEEDTFVATNLAGATAPDDPQFSVQLTVDSNHRQLILSTTYQSIIHLMSPMSNSVLNTFISANLVSDQTNCYDIPSKLTKIPSLIVDPIM